MKNFRGIAMGTIAACVFAGSGAFAADAGAPNAAAPAVPNAADPVLPNVAGTYRCEAEQNFCDLGKTFTVTQNGPMLSIQNERGVSGFASLTSELTINVHGPWNTVGVIRGANKNIISLSNGTRWVKM
jgi:hypothetical protein